LRAREFQPVQRKELMGTFTRYAAAVKRGLHNNPQVNSAAKRAIIWLRTRHLLSVYTTQSLINHFQLWGD
jgi:hypothetical protein